uniref:Gag-pol protein n=1 Tax=Solanum tuberosum TaxID=4113 RepID=M1DE23_SOLTU
MVADMRSKMSLFIVELPRLSSKKKGPAPSSASAPALRNKCEYNSQNSQNFRARPAHSQDVEGNRFYAIASRQEQEDSPNVVTSMIQVFNFDILPEQLFEPFSVSTFDEGGVVVINEVESSLVSKVKEKQDQDPLLLELKASVHKQKVMAFEQGGDGVLRYQGLGEKRKEEEKGEEKQDSSR